MLTDQNEITKNTKASVRGMTIAFLGPDGSGKSTIISGLLQRSLPFIRHDYFHLKPIPQGKNKDDNPVENPHNDPTYGIFKSYFKLLYFIWQYNWGWIKNIIPLRNKSSLIIFDRYYDDLMVDFKRYRYGGSAAMAQFVRKFIPRPELYFILTSDATIIYQRKQEVSFEELERQCRAYKSLADGRRYFTIEVNRSPELIVQEVHEIIMRRLNEHH